MALRDRNNVGPVELAGIAVVVQSILIAVRDDRRGHLTQSLLGAKDLCSLTARGSLNVRDDVEKGVFVIGAGSGEVGRAAEVILRSIGPAGVDVIQELLTERLGHVCDHLIKICATGENAVHLIVDLYNTKLGWDCDLSHAAETLTTDTLRAVRSLCDEIPVVILDLKQVHIALCHVSVFNHGVEEVRILQSLGYGALQNFLDERKHTVVLAVAELLIIELGAAAVHFNEGFAQSLGGIVNRIVCRCNAVISVNTHLDQIGNVCHCVFPPSK